VGRAKDIGKKKTAVAGSRRSKDELEGREDTGAVRRVKETKIGSGNAHNQSGVKEEETPLVAGKKKITRI